MPGVTDEVGAVRSVGQGRSIEATQAVIAKTRGGTEFSDCGQVRSSNIVVGEG